MPVPHVSTSRSIDALVASALAAPPRDPFAALRRRTDLHRRGHGCGAYTYDKAPLLLALAQLVGARRILELGTALGYTSLSLAAGEPRSIVDTLEGDAAHVALAREEIERAGSSGRIHVHHGDFLDLLPGLSPAYDLVFFDGFAPSLETYRQIDRLLAPDGVLVSGNLTLAGGEAYRAQIHDPTRWSTRDLDPGGETSLSLRAAPRVA